MTSTSAATTINRSQSLLTTHTRIPILAPARSERSRIEGLLSDIWSREILPFPSMTTRSRSEQLVRNSASLMRRKLSKASFTGSFSKKHGILSQRSRPLECETREHISNNLDGRPDASRIRNAAPNRTKEDDGPPERSTKRPRVELSASCSLEANASEQVMAEVTDCVRCPAPMRAGFQANNDAETLGYSALRASSANSLAVSQSAKFRQSSTPKEKENTSERWNRSGQAQVLWPIAAELKNNGHRVGPAHNFRSLFR